MGEWGKGRIGEWVPIGNHLCNDTIYRIGDNFWIRGLGD